MFCMGTYHSYFLQRNAKLNISIVQIIKSGIRSVLGAAQKFNNILNSKTWSYFFFKWGLLCLYSLEWHFRCCEWKDQHTFTEEHYVNKLQLVLRNATEREKHFISSYFNQTNNLTWHFWVSLKFVVGFSLSLRSGGFLQVLVLQVCAHAAFACVCECARRV